MLNDKSRYNPAIHHRKSIRLKDYDYAKEGLYFITICCHENACLLGEIREENNDLLSEMILNEAGKVAEMCWVNIPTHFPNIILHEYVIMPNHIHGIIEISPKIMRTNQYSPHNDDGRTKGVSFRHSPNSDTDNIRAKNISPLPRSPSKTIGSVVRGFKIGVTKWFRQNTDVHNVWQRNYYDIIIRDDKAYQNISSYIVNNPAKWAIDKFYRK